jgi:RNA polymerase sigma factor (sigma-70 family)
LSLENSSWRPNNAGVIPISPPSVTSAIGLCLDRLRRGDESARNDLLRVTHERLLSIVRRQLARYAKVRRFFQSDDVLQNVSIRLLRALEQIPVTHPLDFLALAALNVRRELIDLKRKIDKPGWPVTPGTNGLPPDLPGREPDPARVAIWSELHEIVDRLPEDERRVIDLRWYHGLTVEEVADLLNVSDSTVKRLWASARARLAGTLTDPDVETEKN